MTWPPPDLWTDGDQEADDHLAEASDLEATRRHLDLFTDLASMPSLLAPVVENTSSRCSQRDAPAVLPAAGSEQVPDRVRGRYREDRQERDARSALYPTGQRDVMGVPRRRAA